MSGQGDAGENRKDNKQQKKALNRTGRKKGARNIRTREVSEILASMGVNPVQELAELAIRAKKDGDERLAMEANAKLLPYYAPKLSAKDINVSGETSISISVATGVPGSERVISEQQLSQDGLKYGTGSDNAAKAHDT